MSHETIFLSNACPSKCDVNRITILVIYFIEANFFFFLSQNVRDGFLCLSMFSAFHGSTDPPSVADENEYLPQHNFAVFVTNIK